MAMSDIVNRASRPVAGERYHVNGIAMGEVDDKYHPGEKRPVLYLDTDKGRIYATSGMAREAVADPDDAAHVLIGSDLIGYEYYSKIANRDLVGLRMVTE